MKVLGEDNQRFGIWGHKYSDDTQLFLYSSNAKGTVKVLNHSLEMWMPQGLNLYFMLFNIFVKPLILNCFLETVWRQIRASTLKLMANKTEVLLVEKPMFWILNYCPALIRVIFPLRKQSHKVLLDSGWQLW